MAYTEINMQLTNYHYCIISHLIRHNLYNKNISPPFAIRYEQPMIVHLLDPNIVILWYEPSDLKRCVGANHLNHNLLALARFQMIGLIGRFILQCVADAISPRAGWTNSNPERHQEDSYSWSSLHGRFMSSTFFSLNSRLAFKCECLHLNYILKCFNRITCKCSCAVKQLHLIANANASVVRNDIQIQMQMF